MNIVNVLLQFGLDFIIFFAELALESLLSDTVVCFQILLTNTHLVADLAVKVEVDLSLVDDLVTFNLSHILAIITFQPELVFLFVVKPELTTSLKTLFAYITGSFLRTDKVLVNLVLGSGKSLIAILAQCFIISLYSFTFTTRNLTLLSLGSISFLRFMFCAYLK